MPGWRVVLVLALFNALNLLDLGFTYIWYDVFSYLDELNPVMAFMLANGSWWSLLVFKFFTGFFFSFMVYRFYVLTWVRVAFACISVFYMIIVLSHIFFLSWVLI